ncbi:hypothetical protein THRCLA_01675 [Thraustotheca clavata]|uniref:Uncharacterized protein n=1 Tax=Thraustotheca clavata TaxID=74557 RepID=A0A1W0A7V0_9STRA|nr:hypothetical protein THRCLA_01675 [Thraustotheca clavata]
MRGYVCWLTKEHLEEALRHALTRAQLMVDVKTVSASDMAAVVSEFHDNFADTMRELVRASGDSMALRGEFLLRLEDIMSASRARGEKLYGFDGDQDCSQVARLDVAEDVETVVMDPPLMEEEIVYERNSSSSSSSADDSDDDTCSWKASSGDDDASFGEGDESEVESNYKITIRTTPGSVYWLPRRLILRLYRDTCAELFMTAHPITRKALSALHSLLESELDRLLTKHLYNVAERHHLAYVSRLEKELKDVKEELRMTTPKLLRRSKRRLSGDVLNTMATEVQKRKSPRRAKENTTPLRNKMNLLHVGRKVVVSP